MRPRHFNAAAQRGYFNGAQQKSYLGHFVAAHTGTGVYNVTIPLGPAGLDRQTIVFLHCVANISTLTNVPVVTLGGLKPVHHHEDRVIVAASESSRAVVSLEFDTSGLAADEAQLSITPVQSQTGLVIGVWSFLGHHLTAARGASVINVNTADIESVFEGESVIGLFTHAGNADAIGWTAGATTERYDADSGSTIAASGADEFDPTPATPYTVTITEPGTTEVLMANAFVPKRGKDDRLLAALRPTGAHGSNDFEDGSWRRRDLSVTGAPTVNTNDKRLAAGPGAVEFSGAGTNYFETSAFTTPALCKETGWCAEWWEYAHSTSSSRARIGGSLGSTFLLGWNSMTWYMSSDGGNWDIANARNFGSDLINQWVHRALSWDGDTWRAFEDGVLIDTVASSLTPHYGSGLKTRIGLAAGGNQFDGLLEDVAIWRYPRYTAAFTPPAHPLQT